MENWRLNIWGPTGAGPVTVLRDASTMRNSGIYMRVTPEGDCVEAAFEARGLPREGMAALSPLSVVQLEYQVGGTVYVPLFVGQVRQGGNPRNLTGEKYILRSLALRLKRVTLSPGFSAPKQSAHLTIRAIIQDVIASGQLGTPSLILYAEALCPDLGFDAPEVKSANENDPYSLLEAIASAGKALSIDVAFGVDPARRFFCRVQKTDVQAVICLNPDWQPPVAEDPVTAVRWYVAKRPDGTWLTHVSRSPEAATYGDWVDRRPAPLNPTGLMIVPGKYFYDELINGVWTQVEELSASVIEFLQDGDKSRTAINYSTNTAQNLRLRFVPNADAPEVKRVAVTGVVYLNAEGERGFLKAKAFSDGETSPPDPYEMSGEPMFYYGDRPPPPTPRSYTLERWQDAPSGTQISIQIAEFRPEGINTALLDGLARSYYRTPAQAPAQIETAQFFLPGDLRGRVSCTPDIGGAYENRVEVWEYRLTGPRGLTVAAIAGQTDDPDRLAMAALIKARDGLAVIDAITAPI